MKAIWNNQVIAESDNTLVVESNHYFPMASIQQEYFKESNKKTVCFWKGKASYFDIIVDGKVNVAAAWYYPETKERAKSIEGMIAFWRGIEIIDV